MGTKRARWAIRAVLAVVVVAIASAAPLSASAAPAKHHPPGKHTHLYVLALGDSITAGTQPTGPQAVPFGSPAQEVNRSGQGYADQLVASLRAKGMNVRLVDLACNRETTQTMIDGSGSLCRYHHKSQLAEAVQFLHEHGKRTLGVVMSLGVADAFFACQPLDAACYTARLATATTNLNIILGALRTAGRDVPIATVNYADPFLAAWVIPALGGPQVAQLSIPLAVDPLRQFVQTAYAPYGVTIVDTMSLLQSEDFADTTTIPVFGTVPVNVANICTYTWMCTWGDLHPNSMGYGLIAQAVEHALAL